MAKKLAQLDSGQPHIMAILNATPDSFSDGGSYYNDSKLSLALIQDRAQAMVLEGASIIDVGGESTRPGAAEVSLQQEMDRVLPVLEALQSLDVVLSVDSSSPELMLEAAKLSVGLINDVRALQRPGALEAVAKLQLPVCLMHMQGSPASMQELPQYENIIDDVVSFFQQRLVACELAGIARENIILDPGFGFGKSMRHNALLLQYLEKFKILGLPVLVGLSRKSMIDQLLQGRAVDDREAASIVLAAMAVERGAWIVRVHDVKASFDAINIVAAIRRETERK